VFLVLIGTQSHSKNRRQDAGATKPLSIKASNRSAGFPGNANLPIGGLELKRAKNYKSAK
jgi:hypothetical protein